jgi:hypothetical protein
MWNNNPFLCLTDPPPFNQSSLQAKQKQKNIVCSIVRVDPNSQVCGFCGSNTVPPDIMFLKLDFSLALSQVS